MLANRRTWLKFGALAAGSALIPAPLRAIGRASQVRLLQLAYPGGNWQPRPSALRRLAWEVHKRTVIDTDLEPAEIKPTTGLLASSPFAYLAGDREFPPFDERAVFALSRFLKLGGTLVIDPARTSGGDNRGFRRSVDKLLTSILPTTQGGEIPSEHVIYRAFYKIGRPMGRIEGPPRLVGWNVDGRMAVIRTDHDLGGAWSRDNLGNWEHEVIPGGERQREKAFRLGVNLVMYALCVDYKDEEPHRRFGRQEIERG